MAQLRPVTAFPNQTPPVMIRQTYEIEIITPCFLGGAEPEQRAEIRASSIRGQLRWWFRVLGGFKSLAEKNLSVGQQEDMIFGAIADNAKGNAGLLTVREFGSSPSSDVRDDKAMNATIYDDRGYFLFPLRATDRGKTSHARAVLNPNMQARSPSFNLAIVWRGNSKLKNDFDSLIHVFTCLGSLGFRGRRAMGALALKNPSMTLASALEGFSYSRAIDIRAISCTDGSTTINVLARWLKSWKAHGHTGQNTPEQSSPGFRFAKHDHDVAVSGGDYGYRPALGLPLLTKYGNWNAELPPRSKQTAGRFASPVILRPHKDANGKWHALVIFVDAKKWPEGKQVFLNGQPKNVSLDLYEAMKADPVLSTFP